MNYSKIWNFKKDSVSFVITSHLPFVLKITLGRLEVAALKNSCSIRCVVHRCGRQSVGCTQLWIWMRNLKWGGILDRRYASNHTRLLFSFRSLHKEETHTLIKTNKENRVKMPRILQSHLLLRWNSVMTMNSMTILLRVVTKSCRFSEITWLSWNKKTN
jgi:hypothetical protein